jgi:hypothetical protein
MVDKWEITTADLPSSEVTKRSNSQLHDTPFLDELRRQIELVSDSDFYEPAEPTPSSGT